MNPAGLETPDVMSCQRATLQHARRRKEEVPSMWAFIVAIIVFGLTLVISTFVLFRYGTHDNQSLSPSRAAKTTFTVGTLIAFALAASHWLPEPRPTLSPDFDAALFPPFLALLLAALLAALSALLRALLRW
jgi:Ni/Fe-hydrogenase subunit HybB-like protein